MGFNKAKCEMLHLDCDNPHNQYMLENVKMEHSPAIKGLGAVGASWTRTLAAQKYLGQQVDGDSCAPLLFSRMKRKELFLLALWSQV